MIENALVAGIGLGVSGVIKIQEVGALPLVISTS